MKKYLLLIALGLFLMSMGFAVAFPLTDGVHWTATLSFILMIITLTVDAIVNKRFK